MLSYITAIFALLLVVSVQGLQINFNSYSEMNQYEDATNAMMVKDTAQVYYESIVDDILSQHNEGLLSELSIVIKDPQQMYTLMRPQAEVLYGLEQTTPLQDVCVAQMPGMIANQIHELSNEIYTSVDSIVSQFWKTTDKSYRKLLLNAINDGLNEQQVMDELTDALEIVNMDIADRITQTIDQYQMLQKLKQALISCQSIFSIEGSDQGLKKREVNEVSLSDMIWSAVLNSFHLSNPTMEVNLKQNGFMGKYIHELKSDIQSELYSRVYELARSIYEDLAFSSSSA